MIRKIDFDDEEDYIPLVWWKSLFPPLKEVPTTRGEVLATVTQPKKYASTGPIMQHVIQEVLETDT